MRTEIRTFSDIDYAIDEIRYWIDHGDYDRIYSNRGYVLEKARDLMTPAYVHLWMIMYQLEGQDNTINNNVADLANWLKQIIDRIKNKITLSTVYVDLSGDYLRYVRSELHKNHGYPNLNGKLGDDISFKMNDIFNEIGSNLLRNKKKYKHYEIDKQTIEGIIKYVLDIN